MTTYTKVFGGDTVPPSDYQFRAFALTANTTLYWPENNDGDDLAASLMNVTPDAAGWTLTLPAADQVSTGRDFVIRNLGADSFSVVDNSGGAVATIAAGESRYFYLTDNSTVAGVWSVFTYGTGTSSADASALAGYGLTVLDGELNSAMPIAGLGGVHTISTTDRARFLVYQGGTASWTVPDYTTLPNGFWCAINNAGTGTLTLDASATTTVDESGTKMLQPGESLILANSASSNGWFTVGYGRSAEFAFTQLAVDVSATGATYTVTSAQAINKLWYFYNTATGDVTVTIPAVASVYFVRAGAIGAGNDITLTTGSGSVITISANQSYTIYCDGTNVVSAQTVAVTSTLSLADGSATTPSLEFELDTDTGIYRAAENTLGITANGAMVALFGPTGVTLATDLAVTEGGTGASTAAGARTNLGVAIGTNVQAWDADLDALAAVSGTGLLVRTGAGTAATRELIGPAAGISVTDGTGVSGNPTLTLSDDLQQLEDYSGTGIIARTGSNAWQKASAVYLSAPTYAVDTGVANAYVITLDPVPSSYTDGMLVAFRVTNANTGAATINVNSLGVKALKRQNGVALTAGDLEAGYTYAFRYSSASGNFELTSLASGDLVDIATVSGIAADVTAVAGIAADVTAVVGISGDVTAVAADSVDIGTVAADIANVNTVATDIASVNTAATNIAAIIDAPAQASAAAASASAAAASYDSFDDRYLGSKAADPTLDNDGNALLTGALYWNSVAGQMRVYDGAAWQVAYLPSGAYVVGPASATDGNIALFDGTSGKLLKEGSTPVSSSDAIGYSLVFGS